MKANLTRNLQIGFGFSLILLIVTSIASYVSIKNLLQSSIMVNHTNVVIQRLESVISTIKDAETGQRGYLLTGEQVYLKPYEGATSQAISILDGIDSLTSDNETQQEDLDSLRQIITRRLNILQSIIDTKRRTNLYSMADLEKGRSYMDQARILIRRMQNREDSLLKTRTESMNRFSSVTPFIIVLAALFAIVITIYSYLRVNRDIKARALLQRELEAKDEEVTRRIDIIQNIAENISGGDYQVRITDEQKDGLGSLAFSLNKMAESLQYSFGLLSDKEWLQTGVASLNEKMVIESDIDALTYKIVEFLVSYTDSNVGAFYVLEPDNYLKLYSGYAFAHGGKRDQIKIGDGIVGQAALSIKEIIVNDVSKENFTISFATGEIAPKSIIALPVCYENKVNGVIELGSLNNFSQRELEFLTTVAHNIGIAINTAQNRRRLQELLEETQTQTEELQSQHSELENLNSELEAQTQKLQASEEELRVQQEELLQANQELEERSRLLEDKNQLIVERNLDIQQKAEELELSTKYKSEFLANMSHELRTPLNSILLLSRLLSENTENNLNSEQVESAKVIQSSGKGLLSLIDEILDLSKIEAGKMELEYQDIPVNEITNDMKALFTPIAREKNLELKVSVDAKVPATISTDKMRLEQILKNLLSNALKFTAKGSVEMQVILSEKDSAFVHFIVRDTGIGIPEDKRQLIFEAFQQADGSTRRKYGGTGLGLSISRELVKLLGGEINLTSEPGKGSQFEVYIPLKQLVADQKNELIFNLTLPKKEDIVLQNVFAPMRHIAASIPEEIPDDRQSFNPGDSCILIIEDDTSFAKVLLDYTRKRGYKGIVAVRGDLGIEMAGQYRPLAILLDIELPVKDGWEVMEELKTNPRTRHIPVHIMSSMEVKKESLIKGAVDFINKPVALEQMNSIFQTLENVLNKHPKKVLIVEENPKHAKALAYYLETFNISAEIKGSVSDGVNALTKDNIDCVILDMGIPDQNAYETLETIKKNPGLENLPIIIFTGKNLSKAEENRIKQYADSIVVKTAHSYQRILDEVALFLHLIEENQKSDNPKSSLNKLGVLNEVLQNKTVLVADDDVRNIFSLTKALEQHKMKVISALDGKEALKQLEVNPTIDIVLMDMMMPEMDGYESIMEIRKNLKFRNLPVLAVTAKAMLGDREKCIKAGASDYISKPVDVDQLISLLRVWLYDRTI